VDIEAVACVHNLQYRFSTDWCPFLWHCDNCWSFVLCSCIVN